MIVEECLIYTARFTLPFIALFLVCKVVHKWRISSFLVIVGHIWESTSTYYGSRTLISDTIEHIWTSLLHNGLCERILFRTEDFWWVYFPHDLTSSFW